MNREFFFLILYCITFVSCKKNSDHTPPQIRVISPQENVIFNVSDSIVVSGQIYDDKKLDYVSISLFDENYSGVANSITLYPESNSMTFSEEIIITNQLLATGNYIICVSASDGSNQTNEFVKIKLNEITKKSRYVLVVTKNNNQLHLFKIDSAENQHFLKSVLSDYSNSDVCNNRNLFAISGTYNGDLSVFSTMDWQLQWTIPFSSSPPLACFEELSFQDEDLYVSYWQGKFEAYDYMGNIIAQKPLEFQYFPKIFLKKNDKLEAYEVNPSGNLKYFMVYFIPSYTIENKIQINYQILKMFNLNDKESLLICNNSGNGEIRRYNLESHIMTNIYQLNNEEIISACEVNNEYFLITTQTNVYKFFVSNPGAFVLNSSANPKNICYDESAGYYYFSHDDFNLSKYSYLSSSFVKSWVFQDTIVGVHIIYNKD